MRRSFLLLLMSPIVVAIACGESSSTPPVQTAGSSAGSVAGSAGIAGSGGYIGYTLENVCDLLPDRMCGVREDCCVASGVGYDAYHCKALVHDQCLSNLDLIATGEMTFHADKIDPCLVEWQTLSAGCDVSLLDWDTVTGPLQICHQAFLGSKLAYESCTSDTQCSPYQDDAYLDCRQGYCHPHRQLAKDATCDDNGNGDPLATCRQGLTCHQHLFGETCQITPATGATCPLPSNGIGCDGLDFCNDNHICERKYELGQSCTDSDQCRSNLCLGGACQHIGPMFSHAECGKP